MPHLQFSSQMPSLLVLEFAKSRSTKTSLGLEKPLDMPLYPPAHAPDPCAQTERTQAVGAGDPSCPRGWKSPRACPFLHGWTPAWPGRALHAGQLSSK